MGSGSVEGLWGVGQWRGCEEWGCGGAVGSGAVEGLWGVGLWRGCEEWVSGIWYLVDPPEAPTQPEGFPENVGHPTATWRLTRSRQGGSKRAAHARTLRHQGLTPAVVLGVWGGGGSAGLGVRLGSPRVEWVASRGCQSRQGAAQGRGLGLRRGAVGGCAWAQTGAAQGRRLGPRRGADWGCACAQTGAAQGRRLGLRRGADWGCAWAQTGAAQERSCEEWGCGGAVGSGAVEGLWGVGLWRGCGEWGCGGAVRSGAVEGLWGVGLWRGCGEGGCGGAVGSGAVEGLWGVGLWRGCGE